jgi:hypothetical protein
MKYENVLKENLLDALEAILEKDKLNLNNEFICLVAKNYWNKNFDYIPNSDFDDLIEQYKPTKDNQFSEFVNGKYWLGRTSWWDWDDDQWGEVKEIKYKYIQQLIDVLKKELNQ